MAMLNKWCAKWSYEKILQRQVSYMMYSIQRAARSTVSLPEPRLPRDQPIILYSFPIIHCCLSGTASGKVSCAVLIILGWQVNYELSSALYMMRSGRLQIDLSERLSQET